MHTAETERSQFCVALLWLRRRLFDIVKDYTHFGWQTMCWQCQFKVWEIPVGKDDE
ncbi:hypothetical protein Sjap_023978 [Stephania japonica]|uniref:Uncharacterized protein n=1 Tax=Stephania japonica TaxID=461633 RepID=A0AAP0ECL2_9MAGN